METAVYLIILILSIIITARVNRMISSHIVLETSSHAGKRIFVIWFISVMVLGAVAYRFGLIDINKKSSKEQSVKQIESNRDAVSSENRHLDQNGTDTESKLDEEDINYEAKEGGDFDEESIDYEEEGGEDFSNSGNLDEYIFPESDTKKLSVKEIKKYGSTKLRIAKNEIYARHGRMFNDASLQEYFDSMSWYEGRIAPEDFDESVLNSIEKANIRLLAKYEK